jgi:ParB family chromosome partitioning protein
MSTTARRTLHIDDPIGGQVCHVAHPGADLEGKLREIPLSEIHPNPNQPRKRIDEAALNALAESIHERGVLQPIIVRPRAVGGFEIVAGERRWRASRLAWQKTIPALVDDEDSDASPLELALIENVVREDLTPIEEARAIATLREDLHITASDLAKRLGRGRADLTHTVRLLDLPDEAIDLIHAGGLTKGHGKALLTEPDHGHRRQLARQAVERGWSVRALEAEIARPPSHARTKPHPDQSAAAIRLEDAVTRALGVDIRARPRGRGFQLLLDQAASTRLLKLLGNA